MLRSRTRFIYRSCWLQEFKTTTVMLFVVQLSVQYSRKYSIRAGQSLLRRAIPMELHNYTVDAIFPNLDKFLATAQRQTPN